MKAIVQDTYGGTEVLRLDEVEQPQIGATDVLVRVRAAGVDPGVWHLMTGTPYLYRVSGAGVSRPRVRVRGRDLAGVVEAVGADVTRFRPGDEVYGTCEGGSFAEFATAKETKLVHKPPTVSFEQAAVTAISGGTALQAVRDAGRVEAGQRVVVIGAAGGVGSFAVQIAVALGAQVTAVCSASKAELVRSLGALDVIDYAREEVDRDGAAYDLVIDTAGNRRLSVLRRALKPKGTLVIVGGESASGRMLSGFERLLFAPLASLFTSQRLVGLVAKERVADYLVLNQLMTDGSVVPIVDRTYPLAEAPQAIDHVAQGHARGKVAVVI